MNTQLKNNEVHIWLIECDSTKNFKICSTGTLSTEEVLRAKRFKQAETGKIWAFFHTALRDILSRYVDFSAADIKFALDHRQKPYLTNTIDLPLYFNLSHSGKFALVAVTRLAPLGVDIEVTKKIQDADNVAKRFFSKQENSQLIKLSKDKFIQSFYQIWTAKEAVIKANGLGMSALLDSFDVLVERYSDWFSPTLGNPMADTGVYWIRHLLPRLDCCGAVCLNIIAPQTIENFDINKVILKEMFFENNNL